MPRFEEPHRRGYLHGEDVALEAKASPGAKVRFSVSGWNRKEVIANSDGKATFSFPASLLKPGEYSVFAEAGDESSKTAVPITIGPAFQEDRIRVLAWGHVASKEQMDWLQARGFDGGTLARAQVLEHETPAMRERIVDLMEHGARIGFETGLYIHPLAARKVFLKKTPEARVLHVNGKRREFPPDIWIADPLADAMRAFSRTLTDNTVKDFGAYPTWTYSLLTSEHQSYTSINPEVLAMAKEDIGLNFGDYLRGSMFRRIPEEKLEMAIIPDDDPDYVARKWFYDKGNGTALLNLEILEILRAARPDMHATHEPWRQAPTRDTAKGLNTIGSWTYAQKDLKRFLFGTYLRAPGRKENQDIEAVLSLFVYGYTVMRLDHSTAKVSEDQPKDDPYFTADPDYVREALWIYLSQRPAQYSIYWGSRYAGENAKLDRFLNVPEAYDVIGEFSRTVLQPFGAAIYATKPAQAKVAVHLSAVSNWFTHRKLNWNRCEETLPYAILLAMNHVPFDVLLDDDIKEGALQRYEAVVLPHAETFTESIHSELQKFQSQGGTIIANDPIRTSFEKATVTQFDFTPIDRQDGRLVAKGEATTADEVREMMEKYAKELAPLVAKWQGSTVARGGRVVTNTLEGGEVSYHFAINDDRTYGPRFGEHKLYFESGVRQRAKLSLQRSSGAKFYDIVSQKSLEGDWNAGRFDTEMWLAAAEGRIIASLPEDLHEPAISEIESGIRRGEEATLKLNLSYTSGRPVKGVVPIRIRIIDELGTETHHSRYLAYKGEELNYSFSPALNDVPGKWTIRVEELISGKTTSNEVTCH